MTANRVAAVDEVWSTLVKNLLNIENKQFSDIFEQFLISLSTRFAESSTATISSGY